LLEHSDRSVHAALQAFSAMGAEVGLFSPTANGLDKSIFDSHENLCSFFKRYKIHDYYKQIKGTDHKRLLDISILTPEGIKLSQISFYRPNTKNGDPRFWVRGIKESANPKNLLGIFVVNSVLYITNLSDEEIFNKSNELQLCILNLFRLDKANMNTDNQIQENAQSPVKIDFPKDLVEWAGHHSGGVKRLFDESSGRPSKDLIKTSLIVRLDSWVESLPSNSNDTPRIVLLVGGPGNGKTEAIENTIKKVDSAFSANGVIIDKLAHDFRPKPGQAVSRVVTVNSKDFEFINTEFQLDIVQDATAVISDTKKTAANLLIDELNVLLNSKKQHFYLCCINRGVLDEALITSIDQSNKVVTNLLEEITKAVSLSSTAPQCWPLEGHPQIAVWPMDAESLFIPLDPTTGSPAHSLFKHAVNPAHWKKLGTCSAVNHCPFCNSQALLSKPMILDATLKILRWYELASGKRWSFRDLFSLISYLLSGHRVESRSKHADPCSWAKSLVDLDSSSKVSRTPSKQETTAIFYLASSGFQHALFHHWDKGLSVELKSALKDLGIDKSNDEGRLLFGFQQYIFEKKASYLPATIAPVLISMSELLDPALADPTKEITISTRSKFLLSDLDTRFSKSVQSGYDFIKGLNILSINESELLKRMARAEDYLSTSSIRKKKPTSANFIQRCLRDFSCRLVRRSICTKLGVVADQEILISYQEIVEDQDGKNLHEVSKQVKALLNEQDGFKVSLTTTFGQPLPPSQRQATLIVPSRNVRPMQVNNQGRPKSPICYLKIGTGDSAQGIALTYDLFHAIKDLDNGLSPASLSRNVMALLDTTKARLSGPIVRDSELWEDAKISIGSNGTEITKSFTGFVALGGKE
jgi:hypothetical protein